MRHGPVGPEFRCKGEAKQRQFSHAILQLLILVVDHHVPRSLHLSIDLLGLLISTSWFCYVFEVALGPLLLANSLNRVAPHDIQYRPSPSDTSNGNKGRSRDIAPACATCFACILRAQVYHHYGPACEAPGVSIRVSLSRIQRATTFFCRIVLPFLPFSCYIKRILTYDALAASRTTNWLVGWDSSRRSSTKSLRCCRMTH